ncbi:MAG: DNA polymerase III subunit delta [Lachnospira sp.]|nr:DNA polymerase III subunit delta [Lachnospira sp.]
MLKLDDIIGEEQIKEHFTGAIEQKKVSHAYIFEGEAGCGKKALAYAFAKILQCEKGESTPCGCCQSCLQAESGNHPDIITVTHAKPNSFGVEEMRQQLVNDMEIKPYSGRYKIYIIPDAELLTGEAQNAILKTIEEPPSYGIVMLLTTNTGRFLPTIMSRCVKLTVKPVDNRKVYQYLEDHYELDEEMLRFATEFAFGNIGKACRCVESEEFLEMRDMCIHMLKHIPEWEIPDIVFSVKEAAQYKLQMLDFLDMMSMWFRDVLFIKVTKNPNKLIFREQFRVLLDQAKYISYEGIEDIIRAIDNAKVRIDANVGEEVVLELLLFRIKEHLKWMK